MNTPTNPRVDALDGLRGVAILAVLFSHLTVYAPTPDSAWLAGLAEIGARGVDLFFALSGFLIFERLRQTRDHPGWLHDFCLRRAAKIVPLYAALLVVVYLALPSLLAATGFSNKLAAQNVVAGDWPWYATFTSNALNILQGRFVNPAVDVVWSLAVEVQFYLLAALAFSLRRDGGTLRFWLAVAAGAAVLRVGALALGFGWIPVLVFTPGRLDSFVAGIVLALGPVRLPSWLRVLGLAGLAVCGFPAWSREGVWGMTIGYAWVALGCAVLIDLARRPVATHRFARFLTWRTLRVLGAWSYALYLTHIPIRAALRDILLPGERTLDSAEAWLQQGLFYLGAGSVCVFVAAIAWRWFERPARDLMLKLRST